jgi:transposase
MSIRDDIKNLWSETNDVDLIAKKVGRGRDAVEYHLRKLNINLNARKIINKDVVVKLLEEGLSMSEIGNKLGFNVSSISIFCKRNNLKSSHEHMNKSASKILPDDEMYEKYISGISLDALKKEFDVPVSTIKRHLKRFKPDIKFRTMDEAKKNLGINLVYLI